MNEQQTEQLLTTLRDISLNLSQINSSLLSINSNMTTNMGALHNLNQINYSIQNSSTNVMLVNESLKELTKKVEEVFYL